MDITVKCPNCYQQVSKENRFCIFCGYDLSDEKPTPVDDATLTHFEPTDYSAPYDGPCYCPKGHDVADPSLGFCPICGSPLVNEPVSADPHETERPSTPAPPRGESRTCECGYICDDPDLTYCPSCGLPLVNLGPLESSGWRCACGSMNGADLAFCEECGKPKGWRPSEPHFIPEEPVVEIPSGMEPLTEFDLAVKSKYGN